MLRPDAFAVVMATGIVSIAAGDQRYRLLSAVLAVLGAVVFAVLAGLALLAVRRWDYRDLDVAMGLFTFVAACAVLATRFRDRPVVLLTLGSAAVAAWLVLTCVATRDMLSTGWPGLRDRAHGGWELASVATSGVAIVAADLSIPVAPLVLWVVAIVIYALVTWLILWRFGRRSSRFRPDHWILMGGLAIAALAGDRLHVAAAVAPWALATLWLPALLCWTVRGRPKLRQFGWWAMVFPLGMYSSATFATAVRMGSAALSSVSLVFFWVALAAWIVVALGTVVGPVLTQAGRAQF